YTLSLHDALPIYLNWGKRAYAVSVLCAATAITLPAQTFTTLHSFDGTDGYLPAAGLVQATNGDFYSTTTSGGTNGIGTVFKITPSGTLTTLYSFCNVDCTDGYFPAAGLVQATNGDFYGITTYGGANDNCEYGGVTVGCGTVFKITPSGTLTTLYSFCAQSGCTDGESPANGLVHATNGNFYGTTAGGGTSPFLPGAGTVFKITPGGTLTTLYNFCSQSGGVCTDGIDPLAALVQATNGDFYGTTYYDGAAGDGTVFRLSVGLCPFVKTRPHFGKVGAAVKILGTD